MDTANSRLTMHGNDEKEINVEKDENLLKITEDSLNGKSLLVHYIVLLVNTYTAIHYS